MHGSGPTERHIGATVINCAIRLREVLQKVARGYGQL